MLGFKEENKLKRKGYKGIVGLDEVGRGSLVGPVVACAFFAGNIKSLKDFKNVKDSNMLSPAQREEVFRVFESHPEVEWGIGSVSEKIIDKINILEATKLAMKRAVNNLKKKVDVDFLILDGNFKLNVEIPQESVIRGDEKIFSCAAASIVAKVRRDRLMKLCHKKYPQYRLDKNKGYLTKYHLRAIKKYGCCSIHRKSFHFS